MLPAGENEPTYIKHLMAEIQATRKECGDGHRESMVAMTKLQTGHAVIKSQIDDISARQAENSRLVTEQSSRIAVNASMITELDKDKDTLFGHITGIKDAIRTGGTIASGSFMTSENGKYVIWAGILIIVGLFGLAGYNVNVKDLTGQ